MEEYKGSITAQITDSAVEYSNQVEGIALSKWGFNKADIEKALLELKAYRDTGLTPEEIKDHEEMFKAYRHVCGGKSPEEIETLQRDLFNANEQISSLEDANLRQADIIRDYRQAEEQGLLIRQIKKWERMVNPYGELEGFICECGYSDTSASNFCPSCGSKMVYGWEASTREAAEVALKGGEGK